MKVQVIGSKPGADLGSSVDRHIYVNGANHFRPESFKGKSDLITGWNVLTPNDIPSRRYVYDSMVSKFFDNLILIDYSMKTAEDHSKLLDSEFK